jgi:hypothetical protein
MADDLSNEFKGIPAAGGPLSPFSANVVPGARIFSADVVPKNRCNRFLQIMLSGRYTWSAEPRSRSGRLRWVAAACAGQTLAALGISQHIGEAIRQIVFEGQ